MLPVAAPRGREGPMSEERVQVEIDSAGIADVRLVRGDKLNAVDRARTSSG